MNELINDKIFRAEIYIKPRRGNMSKKKIQEILDSIRTKMNDEYGDVIKQSSRVSIAEYPARNYIIRSPENKQ